MGKGKQTSRKHEALLLQLLVPSLGLMPSGWLSPVSTIVGSWRHYKSFPGTLFPAGGISRRPGLSFVIIPQLLPLTIHPTVSYGCCSLRRHPFKTAQVQLLLPHALGLRDSHKSLPCLMLEV